MSLSKRVVIPLFFLTLTAVICYLLSVIFPKPRVLEIRDTVSGKVYGTWPIEEHGEFAIEFIHSVNQSPVRETFRVENGKLRPQNVRFYSFGAGMESGSREGLKLSRDGDAIIISGFTVSYREINFITGTVYDHVLFINNEIINLREVAGSPCGESARITIGVK